MNDPYKMNTFWYAFFVVDIKGKPNKYFLNYRRAKNYYSDNYQRISALSGYHLRNGYQLFCATIEY